MRSSKPFLQQRVNKKMSQGTDDATSPTAHKSARTQFKRTDDPCANLRRFVEHAGLGQVDVSFKKLTKQFFSCKIQVGTSSYHSYPSEFRSQAEAARFCADKALADLIPKHLGQRSSRVESSHEDLLERVRSMVEEHQHGVWAWQLELDYSDMYGEVLPSDWLEVVDGSPSIQLEKYGDKYILRHCKPGDNPHDSDGVISSQLTNVEDEATSGGSNSSETPTTTGVGPNVEDEATSGGSNSSETPKTSGVGPNVEDEATSGGSNSSETPKTSGVGPNVEDEAISGGSNSSETPTTTGVGPNEEGEATSGGSNSSETPKTSGVGPNVEDEATSGGSNSSETPKTSGVGPNVEEETTSGGQIVLKHQQ
ncbi:dentin sialophosphoprotein-like [Aethina tumida]|uniref:dentin sialophosphoprotein-like n=1 Tax=Aethina tumida TaxID=116153 RepID=UPI0021478F54|nr:dentin sialophosphoprotein-like [Aethina tumida]